MSTPSVIGALRANLSLGSSQFIKGLDQAQAKLQKFDRGAKNTGKGAKGLGTSFKGMGASFMGAANYAATAAAIIATAAAAAGAAITALTVSVTKNADEIRKSSSAFGMSTDSYQVLAAGAKKYGIEQDKLKDILKDSSEKLGDFIATGGGEMKDFMKNIAEPQGVNAGELLKLPPEERLVKMQQLMDSAKISAQEQSYYWESIANDATYLIPLLTNNGKALGDMESVLYRTGQILGVDVINSLAQTKANADGISGVMDGWGNILVSSMAPGLEEATSKLYEMSVAAQSVRDASAGIGSGIGAGLAGTTDGVAAVSESVTQVSNGAGLLGSILSSLGSIGATAFSFIEAPCRAVWLVFEGIYHTLSTLVSAVLSLADVVIYAFAAILEPINRANTVFNEAFGGVADNISNEMSLGAEIVSTNYELMAASGKAAVDAMIAVFANLPSALGSAAITAANAVTSALASMVAKAAQLLNSLLSGMNKIPGVTLELINVEGIGKDWQLENNFKSAGEIAGQAYAESFKKSSNAILNAKVLGQLPNTPVYGAPIVYGGATQGATVPTYTAPTTTSTVIPTADTGKGGGGGKGAGGGAGMDKDDQKQERALKKLKETLEEYQTTVGMTALQEKIWKAQRDAGALGDAGSEAAIAAMVTQTEQLKKQKDAVDSITDAFKGMFTGIITGSQSGKEALAGLLGKISEMLAERAFMEFLEPIISNGLSSLFGGSGISVGASANGTSNWRGGLTMVGERGPELVSLAKGARVHTSQETRNMLNGSNSGGQAKILVDLSPNLIATQESNTNRKIATSIKHYDKSVVGNRISGVITDPRRK